MCAVKNSFGLAIPTIANAAFEVFDQCWTCEDNYSLSSSHKMDDAGVVTLTSIVNTFPN